MTYMSRCMFALILATLLYLIGSPALSGDNGAD